MNAFDLDKFIQKIVSNILENWEEYPLECHFTDNFGEMLEKLIILHIRVWHLENEIGENYSDDKKVAELKRKIDTCFKQKRPQLIQSINKLIDCALVKNRSLQEDNVKSYTGFENEHCVS